MQLETGSCTVEPSVTGLTSQEIMDYPPATLQRGNSTGYSRSQLSGDGVVLWSTLEDAGTWSQDLPEMLSLKVDHKQVSHPALEVQRSNSSSAFVRLSELVSAPGYPNA